MDEKQFEEYVVNRYRDQIAWYDQKSLWNQRWYNRLQTGVIVFSSITPVLIAIDFCATSSLLKWLPIVTSIIVSLLSATIQLFKFQEHWINYRTTAESLKKEWYYYMANIGEYAHAEEKESVFVNRVESLISRENTIWFTTNKERQPVDSIIT